MMFASAPNITEKLWDLIQTAEPKVVVIEFSGIPDLEFTALNLLAEFEEHLRADGIALWLTALNPEPLRVIRRSPLGKIIGDDRMFFNLDQALSAYMVQMAEGG